MNKTQKMNDKLSKKARELFEKTFFKESSINRRTFHNKWVKAIPEITVEQASECELISFRNMDDLKEAEKLINEYLKSENLL